MEAKIGVLAIFALMPVTMVSAQVSPDLEDRLQEKPDTSKVDVIILNQANANEKASEAVRNANGNVSHEFDIIDGIAATIPKVAAENLANKDFMREIQPDFNVKTNLDQSIETIKADQVWNNSTGQGVDVAVLDTGIENNTILDVDGQVDYTGEGTDDLNGHGTHVAGIVASPDEEYKGVSYNTDLYDVKVLDGDGSGSASDVISGIEYAVENNMDIATLSLGAQVSECDGTSSISEAVNNAVEKGVTVTVAAGNQGPDSETITAPGCAEKPITVGSSANGEISDFSSRGPTADGRQKPELVAPGESITSLTNNDGESPQFETLSGTSMATPYVAGAAALLLSEKDLKPMEIKNITTNTADDLEFDENDQGAGRLNIYEAYKEIAKTENQTNKTENEAPEIESLGVDTSEQNGSIEAKMTVNATDPDNQTLEVNLFFEGKLLNTINDYGEISFTKSNLSTNTTYTWEANASDGINTSTTGELEFETGEFNEDEEENETNNETSKLPPQASKTAKKATAGIFNPTSPLYGLDVAFDRAAVAVGLKSKESVMEERAQEAKIMAERGKEKAAQKAVKNLRNTAGKSENATKEAQQTLERVIEDAPEEAKQGLRNALENVEKERKEKGRKGKSPKSNTSKSDRGQNRRPDNTENRSGPNTTEEKPEKGQMQDKKPNRSGTPENKTGNREQKPTSERESPNQRNQTQKTNETSEKPNQGKNQLEQDQTGENETNSGNKPDQGNTSNPTEEGEEQTPSPKDSEESDSGNNGETSEPEGGNNDQKSGPGNNPRAGSLVGQFFRGLLS